MFDLFEIRKHSKTEEMEKNVPANIDQKKFDTDIQSI